MLNLLVLLIHLQVKGRLLIKAKLKDRQVPLQEARLKSCSQAVVQHGCEFTGLIHHVLSKSRGGL